MKLALVWDKDDHKLQPTSYSGIYRSMMLSIREAFDEVIDIHDSMNAADFDADLILFYDPQSCHHITIKGIENHRAPRIEYITDPHQEEVYGIIQTQNKPIHKLGRTQRVARWKERGIDKVICPTSEGFYTFFSKLLGGEHKTGNLLIHYPFSPSETINTPLSKRKQAILGNGATWDGGIGCYEFRKWAFEQSTITVIPHVIKDNSTPKGDQYIPFLSTYAGGLALCDWYLCPKYFEIPAAGCVTFLQPNKESREVGFINGKNCIEVTKENFLQVTSYFIKYAEEYQSIADAGRLLIEEKYNGRNLAKFLYNLPRHVRPHVLRDNGFLTGSYPLPGGFNDES